ncbi:MAG: hydroxymethylglutaryl-CoA lyase [Bacteroidota bacterium]
MTGSATKIIECPRDAMQGLDYFISTENKIKYINSLLKVGFDVLDCGSFVSPKAVPMLADTADVMDAIDWEDSDTQLLTIIANEKGAVEAGKFPQIQYVGYPFSISEKFQLRNTNHTIEQSLVTLKNIQQIAHDNGQHVVVYLSMGFGNPYGEEWNPQLSIDWSRRIAADLGVKIISLSDTIGVATPDNIRHIIAESIKASPKVEFGAHLHTRPDNYLANITAAYEAGCRRFDGAIKGFGGCPFAADALTGNLPTEHLITFLKEKEQHTHIKQAEFHKAFAVAGEIFMPH